MAPRINILLPLSRCLPAVLLHISQISSPRFFVLLEVDKCLYACYFPPPLSLHHRVHAAARCPLNYTLQPPSQGLTAVLLPALHALLKFYDMNTVGHTCISYRMIGAIIATFRIGIMTEIQLCGNMFPNWRDWLTLMTTVTSNRNIETSAAVYKWKRKSCPG